MAPGYSRADRAALGEGAWWDVRILVDDDDLAAARELPGYAELAEESRRRCEAAHRAEAPIPPVVLRPDGAPRGVLVALHGADQEADDAAETWAAAADAGLVVVAVTSSRRSTPTYRTWPDQGAAAADVRIALETLPDGERELPVEVVDNLGHAYPPDLSGRLRTCQWQAWL